MPKKIITDNTEEELKKLLADPKKAKKLLELLKSEEPAKKSRGRPRKQIITESTAQTQEPETKPVRRSMTRRFDPGSLHNTFDPKEYDKQCRDKEDQVLKKQKVIVNNNRPPATSKNVVCSACNKTYKVPSSYVISSHGYYRCDRCTGS